MANKTGLKVAYFYDHTYYREGEMVYSSGAFTVGSWERYLAGFDQLTVVGNLGEKTGGLNKFNLVSREGVDFYFAENIRNLKNYLLGNLWSSKELENIIRSHDAVIVRVPSEISLIAVSIARAMGKPYAVEVVGCVRRAYWNHGTLKGKLLSGISFYRTTQLVKNAGFVSYVTKFFLQREYPTNGKSIAASNVQIDHYDWADVEKIREKNAARSGPLILGHVGSFNVRFKGQDDLLYAAAKVIGSGVDLFLRMVGPGDAGWIERIAEKLGIWDRVEIVGKLPASQMIYFIDSLDLYVHTSHLEGLPRTVIEAMSRGVPVVGTAVGGIPELLLSEHLLEAKDTGQLAEMLNAFAGTPMTERLRIGADNYERSLDYNIRVLAERRSTFFTAFANEVN
jgi:glycosyltransferase involved in cell wall biosynthesis